MSETLAAQLRKLALEARELVGVPVNMMVLAQDMEALAKEMRAWRPVDSGLYEKPTDDGNYDYASPDELIPEWADRIAAPEPEHE